MNGPKLILKGGWSHGKKKTFNQMVEEAMAEVDGVSPDEVQRRLEQDSDALVVDVRDAAEISSTGLAARGINVSLGNLPVVADQEVPDDWRDPRLQDRSRQVITTCQMGPNAARAAQLLKEMGFSNVDLYGRRYGGLESRWPSNRGALTRGVIAAEVRAASPAESHWTRQHTSNSARKQIFAPREPGMADPSCHRLSSMFSDLRLDGLLEAYVGGSSLGAKPNH